MNLNRTIVGITLTLFVADIAIAQKSYPMLMSLNPVAAQVGQTSEHTIQSRYTMYGAYEVFVTGTGVSGEIVHPEKKEEDKEKTPNLTTMKVKFTVAADALPGVRDFRIATPNGASTLGQLVIARDVVVVEKEDNDKVDQAQEVTVPSTVCGVTGKAEDVDFYKFKVEAGAALNFQVRSMRLQNRIHDLQKHSDPIITLRNASGVTLTSSDNFFYGDPFFAYEFEHGGEYLLEIRDVRYQANQYWSYSIEISDQPFVTNVYPMGVAPGSKQQVELVGFQLPENASAEIDVPMERTVGPHRVALPLGQTLTNPASIVVTDLPIEMETGAANNTADTAQLVKVPSGINGRIETKSDIDCFAFEAKKGERYSFEVVARREQSSVDSHLRILNHEGKQLTLNDDMRLNKRTYSDSLIENWTVPADGKYVIEMRDLHLRGGASFVYFIKVTRADPYFEIYADTDKTPLTPGTNGVVFVRVLRKNGFEGEVQLGIDNLPKGVTASCGKIVADGQDGCIVLSAAKDAPMGMSNVQIKGTATHESGDEKKELAANAAIYQETYQPGGGRGHWPVELHTVSVGSASDILSVTLGAHDIVLKPGESKKIDVTIERTEGFDKNVTLDVVYQHLSSIYGNSLPKNVSLDGGNSKTLLAKGEIKGFITIKAAETADPIEKQQIAVMANVSLNFVMKATYASTPVFVTIVKKDE